MKISVWFYVVALVALTFAHVSWPVEIGNPFNIYRVVALCLAGLLARLAYPSAPCVAFLMIIGTVCALSLVHTLLIGNDGRSMDIIVDMASGLWGVALGAVVGKLRTTSTYRRRGLT